MAQDLTTQLEKLSNQARFVQMIIKKELNISGRKKVEIVKDLKSKGFKSFPKVVKAVVEETENANEEEEDDVATGSDNGYDYLLGVCLFLNLF